jgi:diguanylate cyclase (GGDEF)-like protein
VREGPEAVGGDSSGQWTAAMTTSTQSAVERSFALGYRRLAALLRDVVAEESVASVLERALATLRELVHCEDVVVWEPTDDQTALVVAVIDGEDEEALRSLRIELGEGLTGKAALERRPIVSNDAHLDPAAGLVPGTEQTPEAVACMPLIARERLLGVLTLYRQGDARAFANEEIDLVADFAAVAALALDNARARCELERLATTDELTGLANRRHFLPQLERELASAARYRSSLSLLLLDLDNFKAINDTYGHSAGDRALRLVARSLEDCLRAPDLVARLGGDEFAVLLPQTGRAAAGALAERLTDAVSRLSLPCPLTLSIGLASLKGDDATDLLEEADRVLYREKRSKAAPQPSTATRASKHEAEDVLARRYCRLRDAGYSLAEALALAAAQDRDHTS